MIHSLDLRVRVIPIMLMQTELRESRRRITARACGIYLLIRRDEYFLYFWNSFETGYEDYNNTLRTTVS
jgi:hypothetical protein